MMKYEGDVTNPLRVIAGFRAEGKSMNHFPNLLMKERNGSKVGG